MSKKESLKDGLGKNFVLQQRQYLRQHPHFMVHFPEYLRTIYYLEVIGVLTKKA
ncbi:hypothetical protein HRF87_27045 [Bacillus sp. CRN 9]|nr:hypothetical protein [Bacillus sp. CRN 9]